MNQHRQDGMQANFKEKQTTLTFFGPHLTKKDITIWNSEI